MKLAFVGDLFLADQHSCLGFGVRSVGDRDGYDGLFEHVRGLFREHDLTVGNLECALADPLPGERPGFPAEVDRGRDRGADALGGAGVGLVTLANNHIFEHRDTALARTLANLDRAGVDHVGSRARSRVVRDLGGTRVAFLGWSLLPDTYWPDLRPADHYNVADDLGPVLAEVAEARAEADRVVLLLHWGNEFVPQPSRRHQEMGHQLIDAGVDLLIGCHPHVLQPVEVYRDRLIAYSLGNFVFDSWSEETCTGAVLSVELDRPADYRVVPVRIDPETHAPRPIEDRETAEAVARGMSAVDPIPDAEYRDAVLGARKRYRRSVVGHLLRNLHRYDRRTFLPLVSWGVRRTGYLWSRRRAERADPYQVYRGPMK